MKKRLKKKLLKKKLEAEMGQSASSPELPEWVKVLALECWRIKKLLPELQENRGKHLVLGNSIEKMLEVLARGGVEVEDPEGMEFRDGMTLDVALFEETATLIAGRKLITETLAPAVYVRNRVVQPAKVIVAVGTGKD
jgi:hypothetical protein